MTCGQKCFPSVSRNLENRQVRWSVLFCILASVPNFTQQPARRAPRGHLRPKTLEIEPLFQSLHHDGAIVDPSRCALPRLISTQTSAFPLANTRRTGVGCADGAKRGDFTVSDVSTSFTEHREGGFKPFDPRWTRGAGFTSLASKQD